MEPDILDKKLKRMQLQDAIDNGRYSEVLDLCKAYGITSEPELIHVQGVALINALAHYKIGYTELRVRLKDFLEAEEPSSENASISSTAGLKLDTREAALLKLLKRMEDTIGYHVETGRSAECDPPRKTAMSLLLSEEMTTALNRFAAKIPFSHAIGSLVGTTYHCLLVTAAMEITPLNVLEKYLSQLEIWKTDLTSFVQSTRSSSITSIDHYHCGLFGQTIHYLGMTEIDQYERLRKVADSAIDIANSVYGDVDEVTRQVASWLSYIPSDSAKKHIRNDLLARHTLNAFVLDQNTTPTDKYLLWRLNSALTSWLDHFNGSPQCVLDRVTCDEHKIVVSHAMIGKLRTGDEYTLKRVSDLAVYGDELFDRELVSENFGGIIVEELAKENLQRLKLLVPLIPTFYIGKNKEILQIEIVKKA